MSRRRSARRAGYLRIRAFVALLALAGALVAVGVAPSQATAASCEEGAVTKAPELAGDRGRDGRPLAETTLADGTSIPVLMVHGWTGRSVHDDDRAGSFSSLIDLTENREGAADVGRSLIGQIQDVGGTSVYAFDYHDASARWVTDSAIGPGLAKAITCLSQAHGHPVVLVVHSMGGLASREALGAIGADAFDVSEVVSDVVMFGTPNTGSWLASVVHTADGLMQLGQLVPGGVGTGIAGLRAALILCGLSTSASLDRSGACGLLGEQAGSARSAAALGLRVGSPQLAALPPWPDEVAVHALAGSIDLEVKRLSWFDLRPAPGQVNTGDFVVGTDSATDRADEHAEIRCAYTLDPVGALEDNFVGDWLGQLTKNEARDNLYANLPTSPCYHSNLMRSIELTNDALIAVADVVNRANVDIRRAVQVPEELHGVWCTRSGADYRGFPGDPVEPCFSFDDLLTRYPKATLSWSEYPDPDKPDVRLLNACLDPDLGGGQCGMASTMLFEYYPAGTGWDCEAYAARVGWPNCQPSFTAAHDSSEPRLTVIPNHQQGDSYVDAEPLYRQ